MANSIKAICFDLDGVYFTPKGKNSFHQALISEYGASQEVVDELMYRSPVMAQLVRGKITPVDFWNRVREMTGITTSDEGLTERWVKEYEVNPDVRNAVLKAKESGYKTCVCTNNNTIRLPILIERFKLWEYFDAIVSSHEIGYTKPNREIFEALLERVAVRPDELIYSDDNPDRLSGASALGIVTFVFEDFDQFKEKLKEYDVTLDD